MKRRNRWGLDSPHPQKAKSSLCQRPARGKGPPPRDPVKILVLPR